MSKDDKNNIPNSWDDYSIQYRKSNPFSVDVENYAPDLADLNDKQILEAEGIRTSLIRILTSVQDELDELLESQGLSDDRKIDISKLTEHLRADITPYHSDDPDWYSRSEIHELSKFLIQFFDISEDELDNKQNLRRHRLELQRVAFKIEIQSLEKYLEKLHKKSLKLRKDTNDIIVKGDFGIGKILQILDYSQSNELETKSKSVQTPSITPSITPQSSTQKPIIVQFQIIQELESKLRELLKNIFSDKQDWWEKYVPFEVRDKLEYRNRKDPNFEGLRKDQSLELIDLLMFKEVQIIITGSGFDNYEFFKNIFPNYHYVNERLIEASLLRNPVCHMNELNEKQQKQLLHIKEELVDHINEYLGI